MGQLTDVLAGVPGGGAQQQTTLRGTIEAAIRTADSLPQGAEVNRFGDRYMLGNSAPITGIAPVQVLVTTVTHWTLFNADSVLSYFIEELGMYETSGTAGIGGQLWACVFRLPALVGASTAGIKVANANQGSTKLSKAICQSAITITDAAAPMWYPVAFNTSANVGAFPGSGYLEHRSLAGRITVPPLYGLGLAVVALAGTTPLFAPYAMWTERVGLSS